MSPDEQKRKKDKELARPQVEAFQEVLLELYDLDKDEVKQLLGIVRDLKKRDDRIRQYGRWAANAAIVGVVGYIALEFTRGFHHQILHILHIPINKP